MKARLLAILAGAALLLGAGGIVTAASASTSPSTPATAVHVSSSEEALCFMWPGRNLYVCV